MYIDQPALAMQFPLVELQAARIEDSLVLANLLELYAHDFSEFVPLTIGEDGRFGYKDLPLYWREPNRHAFLIKAGGRLAGLALVKRDPEVSGDHDIWDMAEFFVLRGHRRNRLGTRAAHEVWRLFPGLWQVRVMQANGAACLFWEQAISAFTHQPVRAVRFEKNGTWWKRFLFRSDRPA